MKVELIADYECITGEGPLWHSDEQRLYWVDIPRGRLFRYEPASDRHEPCLEGAAIGGFTVQADGALLLFMEGGVVREWREGTLTTVIPGIPDEADTRFNDVIADPAGRVFCGTMPAARRLGRLYRLDPDGTLTILLEGIGCSNGMGFSPDETLLYYTDSPTNEISVFDYDRATGRIENRRTFVHYDGEGSPDGLTVDAEGFVWSAKWDGGRVVRYAPDGREERRIAVPARKTTSLAFGGADYGDLYITTAGGNERDTDGRHAGALFRVRPEVRGVPEFRSRIAPPK
ncbi:MAG: SMP-30/gluconolactonase/LRE family protein [FCB group bacterium]|nr:SMP-30/gluconolactonase/LRE family protein [FCB group bacterium]